MPHFSFIPHSLTAKNKLDIAVRDYLKTVERKVISDDYFSLFKMTVLIQIKELNEKHNRCKPIEASWYEYDGKDWLLSGVSVCVFRLYKAQ